jgi:phosphate uptake regulator
MVESALSDLKGGSVNIGDLESRMRDIRWLNWLVTRQYNLVLYDASYSDMLEITPADGAYHVIVCKALVRIADHAIRISKSVKGIEAFSPEPIQEVIIEQMDRAVESFREKDRKKAKKTIYALKGMKWVNPDLDRSSDILVRAVVADSMNRIITYIDEIAETAYYSTFMPGPMR